MTITLSTYITRTQLELQNPAGAAAKLYTTADITTYINLARGQLCGESECIRNFGTLPITANNRVYNFSSIALASPSTGIQGPLHVRQSLVQIGTGSLWLHTRPFEWFTYYALNNVAPPTGMPQRWTQYGQGTTGSLYFDPVPDQSYTINVDTVCYPIDLVDDTTFEAIPYPWTDVVPFYAAWYALTSAQRQADADEMMKRVNLYMAKARGMSNPDVLPNAYSQPASDPTLPNRLGISGGGNSQRAG